jgi:YHS domain-containing protein
MISPQRPFVEHERRSGKFTFYCTEKCIEKFRLQEHVVQKL